MNCVDTGGTLDYDFYNLISSIGNMMLLDTQEIEGMNSLVMGLIKRCPYIGLRLLSSRVLSRKVTKTKMQQANSTTGDNFRAMLAAVESEVQGCTSKHGLA